MSKRKPKILIQKTGIKTENFEPKELNKRVPETDRRLPEIEKRKPKTNKGI